MEMDRLLNKLKNEGGVEEERETTTEAQVAETAATVGIQQAIGGGRLALKEWLAKLNERGLDRKITKELKEMVASNVAATDFVDRLFEIIEKK